MTPRKIILMLIMALAIIGGSYAWANAHQTSNAPDPDNASIGLEDSAPASGGKTTDELIEFWANRIKQDPHDFLSMTLLGQTYMRRGRETGDASAYEKAEAAFRNALEIVPDYEVTIAYLSAALFVKHDFQGALDLAGRVYASDPDALQALATVGDAQLELGNYTEAASAYEKLMGKNLGPAVDSRLARLAWLHGRPEDALSQMQRASDGVKTSNLSGESAAWYQFQLGELYFNTGQIDEAAKNYMAALDSFHNYYLALAGLGKVFAAQGRYTEAIDFYQRVVNIIPQPDFLAALGDLYSLTGQPGEAKRQYDTVEFIGKLAKINQQIYNRQLANFYSDHDFHLDEALRLATTELELRKDVYGYDTAAWANYKNGQLGQAQSLIEQAMGLGTRDAKLYYHAGMIARAQGHMTQARRFLSEALSINPYFDLLQVRIARSALDKLIANSN